MAKEISVWLSESAFSWMWTHTRLTTVIAISLILVLGLIPQNVYVLGGYLLSAWLLSPLVTCWLVAEHDTPTSFLVAIYPKPLRIFVAYGWFVGLALLTYVWVMMFVHVTFG